MEMKVCTGAEIVLNGKALELMVNFCYLCVDIARTGSTEIKVSHCVGDLEGEEFGERGLVCLLRQKWECLRGLLCHLLCMVVRCWH